MVRVHKYLPLVKIFILASTKEFVNSPRRYAVRLAATIRGTTPRMESYAAWCGQVGAGGTCPTAQYPSDMKPAAKNPIQMSDTPLESSKPPPELGQHSEEVLLEAGYSWEDIGRLREAEVV